MEILLMNRFIPARPSRYVSALLADLCLSVATIASGAEEHQSHHTSDSQSSSKSQDKRMGVGMMMHMKSLDSNGDGQISKKEFNAHHDKMFKMMDKDGDGMVSVDERHMMMGMMMERMGEEGCPMMKGGMMKGGMMGEGMMKMQGK